jgi:hypothetical protein
LLCACGGGSSEPTPVPRSVDPSTGFAEVATPVRITGDDFLVGPGGGRQRAWLDGVELADVVRVDVHTLTATVPAGLSPGAKTLQVENAFGQSGRLTNAFTVVAVTSRLAASLAVDRSTAGLGQPIQVTLTLTDGGAGDADVTAISPTATGAAATCGAVTPPTPVHLAAGGSQAFTWQCSGSSTGVLELGASATGADTTTGAGSTADATASQVAIQDPASLAAALSVDGNPSSLTMGQAYTLRVTVSDRGGASATIGSLAVTPPEAGCGVPTPRTPVTVAGGQNAVFAFSCAPATAGNLAPAVSVRGQDANTGGLLTASATLASVLTVNAPTTLTTAITATPTAVAMGQTIDVTFYVASGATAATVIGVGPWTTGTGAATCTSVTVPPGTMVAAGASLSFGWSCTTTAAGDLLVGGTLTYSTGGAPLTTSPVPLSAAVTP